MTQGRPQYHTRRDANQAEIKAGLEQLGFVVLDVSPLAEVGFDLLVCGRHGVSGRAMWLAVEVKTATGWLTVREAAMIAELQARFTDAPLIVARDVAEILGWFMRLDE